jgi:ribonuclease HI
MKEISIYTDGACSGNPGPGGWAAILVYGNTEKVISGSHPNTTNNRMELTAVISGLEALKEPCIVNVYSDSKYVVDAVNLGWAKSWQKKGWKRNKEEAAKNPDLWEKLLKLMNIHQVKLLWVKGHDENVYNQRCDKIAVSESKKIFPF